MKMNATIQEAILQRINAVWKKHKPQGLGFSDTDVVLIKLKTETGETFSQDFYCRLKGDGTIGHSITKASEKRQRNLQDFIRKYISREKRYSITRSFKDWKGKEVEVEQVNGGFAIDLR